MTEKETEWGKKKKALSAGKRDNPGAGKKKGDGTTPFSRLEEGSIRNSPLA